MNHETNIDRELQNEPNLIDRSDRPGRVSIYTVARLKARYVVVMSDCGSEAFAPAPSYNSLLLPLNARQACAPRTGTWQKMC